MEWWKILAIGIFAAGCVTACHERDSRLIQKGVEQQLAVEAKQKEADRLANEKKEAEHQKALSDIEQKRVKEKQAYETNLAKLQRDVRTGAERLRIATVRKPPAIPSNPTPGGAQPEEGSDVMPEVASDILGIAGGIGQTVRDYNSLLDAYHSLELSCSK